MPWTVQQPPASTRKLPDEVRRQAVASRIVRFAGSIAACVSIVTALHAATLPPPATSILELAASYERDVDRRLQVPPEEQASYGRLLTQTIEAAGIVFDRPQLVVLVDRNAHAQVAMVWWRAPDGEARLIGASPASTGLPAGFEHFETPTGVFEHSLSHLDFRSQGTRNALGIRGYGRKGMRVFDFGWVSATRGWAPGEQAMRLQMHATDPVRLEPLLGQRRSKGCIRIPAAMNTFLDRRGVLDAAYDDGLAQGRTFWVLPPDRSPTPWPGRHLVVVDSLREARPAWAQPETDAAP